MIRQFSSFGYDGENFFTLGIFMIINHFIDEFQLKILVGA
jgi:hypothetical protein